MLQSIAHLPLVLALPEVALAHCSFTGESMDPDGSLAYAYYKEGASQPTFLFPKYALKGTKC